ncbi:hypothetical protein GUITHDRAFT_69189 [Guillardia theta CCMP2712]|uniref:Inner membrane component domain-containing protein n=1 Tax=Guillardia theta (strain CCMP2712) TaxID=905079 RepID=L1JHS4_GUITC|nr:hypothetical protein GUITHDRAFT_69189 [Guillardia theta CCMP2712]EKX47852.1 hypothetical protein GUITHDRAFT_69189 [Guillardia theta CCMP2712]|eukprot:XP_005834832.1 hypothetical protein GUITHDRAFT_69189 [Guillardia theta CCMP2712]
MSSRGVWSWLGNFMWVVFGGLQSAIVWLIAGLLCCITIVGIPCAHQCFKLSGLSLFPFGQSIVYEPAEPCTFLGNVIWLPMGILIALVHVFWAFLYTCTIIGIPFAVQHIKLAQLALWPFGAEITPLVFHARQG